MNEHTHTQNNAKNDEFATITLAKSLPLRNKFRFDDTFIGEIWSDAFRRGLPAGSRESGAPEYLRNNFAWKRELFPIFYRLARRQQTFEICRVCAPPRDMWRGALCEAHSRQHTHTPPTKPKTCSSSRDKRQSKSLTQIALGQTRYRASAKQPNHWPIETNE